VSNKVLVNAYSSAAARIPTLFAENRAVIEITFSGDDLMGSQVRTGLPDTGPERQFHATVARNTDK